MTLVEANVLLDVATADPRWAAWLEGQLDAAALRGPLVISDIACAEVSVGYARIEDVDAVLAVVGIEVHVIPRAGLFLAGKVFRAYRACGGTRAGVLPDFPDQRAEVVDHLRDEHLAGRRRNVGEGAKSVQSAGWAVDAEQTLTRNGINYVNLNRRTGLRRDGPLPRSAL